MGYKQNRCRHSHASGTKHLVSLVGYSVHGRLLLLNFQLRPGLVELCWEACKQLHIMCFMCLSRGLSVRDPSFLCNLAISDLEHVMVTSMQVVQVQDASPLWSMSDAQVTSKLHGEISQPCGIVFPHCI